MQSPTRHKPYRTRRAAGFSITEMIVVVGILVGVMLILFPVLGALIGGNRVESGLNVAGAAADVARQWVSPSRWDSDSTDSVQYEQYNGTAALFCPTGEIRIVVNDRYARSGGDYLEDSVTTPSPLANNGYKDMPNLDYLRLPNGSGVAGIYRGGGGERLLAPPFAIAFNENGQMNFGNVNGVIFYDAARNGDYDINSGRPSSYDPSDWTGDDDTQNELPGDETGETTHTLPFDAIECVAGVLVYDAVAFAQVHPDAFDSGGEVAPSDDAWDWLMDNGRVLYFSPQTGIALRDEVADD